MANPRAPQGQYERLWRAELLEFLPISRILKKWEPVSFLDKGTFSRIFKVVHRETGEVAALKFVPNPLEAADCQAPNSPEEIFHRTRFEASKREAEIMHHFHGEAGTVQYLEEPEYLKHVFVNDYGELVVRYAVLICMPLYRNHNEWMPYVAQSRELRLKLGMDIAKALMLFEEKGVYHRDIKPGNIMMDQADNFCLGDVGEAKMESESTTMGFHGTRPYMAPEVYKQRNEHTTMRSDHRSDIYSLGIILYRLFNRQQFPFLTSEGTLTEEATRSYRQYEKKNQTADSFLTDSERARHLRYAGRRLPKPSEADGALAQVILRACAYDKKKRYQTAEELYKDLKYCLENPGNALRTAQNPDRRTGYMKMAIGISFAVIMVIVAATSFLLGRKVGISTGNVEGSQAVQTAVFSSAAETPAPAVMPADAPTAALTAAPTATSTAALTAAPTATSTAALTAAPTATPTAALTVAPTATPTAAPTPVPTAAPTAAPTVAPTSALAAVLAQNQKTSSSLETDNRYSRASELNLAKAQTEYLEWLFEFSCKTEILRDGTCKIVKSGNIGPVVIVPLMINDRDVTVIGASAFADCDAIETIVLPRTIHTIEEYAFKDCTALRSIKLPNELLKLEDYAFSGCYRLCDMNVPDSNVSLGENVFHQCTELGQ